MCFGKRFSRDEVDPPTDSLERYDLSPVVGDEVAFFDVLHSK